MRHPIPPLSFLVAVALAGCSDPDPVVEDAAVATIDLPTLPDLPSTDATDAPDAPDATDAPDVPTDAPDVPLDARCVAAPPPDPFAAQRADCAFTTGARVADTLGLDARARAAMPIRHVIVVMKENRSFDQMLGQLHDHGQPETEGIPSTFTNRDARGATVSFTRATTTCSGYDPGHQWNDMHAQVNGGAMDGFVTTAARTAGGNGHQAMTWFGQDDLPFYYWLASTYALNDRHFASVRSGTFPNRNFVLYGTADGVRSTGSGYPRPGTPNLFDRLDAAGITWGAYSDGAYFSASLGWTSSHRGAHSLGDFLTALDAGTLPQVVFVDGVENIDDEHPDGNVQQGEAWTRNVYQHAVRSPLWPGLAMIWTYDEAGGFADHVPPPERACIARPGPTDADYFALGPRVPFVLVSPWARAHHVSHAVQEHTAVTRFIEALFDLPALTARDANSSALLDLFDFTCGPTLLRPPPAPEAGRRGCFGGCRLTLDRSSYRQGEAIRASFAGCPGNNPIDWIAVYPFTAGTPTLPIPGSTLWKYLNNSHVGTVAPTSGTVTLDRAALGRGPWPLPAGEYTAYYLLNDQYRVVDAVDFRVTP